MPLEFNLFLSLFGLHIVHSIFDVLDIFSIFFLSFFFFLVRMAHDGNIDIAEEVARGLAMRSHEPIYVTQNNHNSSNAVVCGIPYTGYVTNGSYFDYVTPQVIDETCASSTVSSTSAQGVYSPSFHPSTRMRSAVGRKPSKGPDGIRRYSSRRKTYERRDRINSRERDRMHQLCDAFERLRQVLPCKRLKQGPHRHRLSKIGTLVLAQNYIRALEVMLQESPDDTSVSTAELDVNGFITSQNSIANQPNGSSNTYYHVDESTELEIGELCAIPSSFNAAQINPHYTQEYYRTESTIQYQF